MIPLRALLRQRPHTLYLKELLRRSVNENDQRNLLICIEGLDAAYQYEILRLYIVAIESQAFEVLPEVWEIYYMHSSSAKESNFTEAYVEYTLGGGNVVLIKENRNSLVERGDTGHRTWESSLALTELICCDNKRFSYPLGNVVELGAGTGLVSLAIGKLGLSQHIYSTDGSRNVVEKLNETVEINGLDDFVQPMFLRWDDLGAAAKLPKNATLFAGDILYGMTDTYPQILDLLDLLSPKQTFFCNPIRNRETYEQFKLLCGDRGYNVSLLKSYSGSSLEESNFMTIVSIPAIPLEVLELSRLPNF